MNYVEFLRFSKFLVMVLIEIQIRDNNEIISTLEFG